MGLRDSRFSAVIYNIFSGWSASNGNAHVMDAFKPSQYDTDLTMDDTGQAVALASGVALGCGRIHVANDGATTESIRVAFGTSSANAIANLNVAAAAATTGYKVRALADSNGEAIIGVPALATYYAICNAVAADRQVVSITQGV